MTEIRHLSAQNDVASPENTLRVKVVAWLILFIVIGTGAAFRGLTFDRQYPVIASGDEAKISLHAMERRDDMPMKEAFGATQIEDSYAYPPLALWVYIQVQRITEAFVQFPFPTDYVNANRAAVAVIGVITSGLMCGLGWVAARPLGRGSAFIAAVIVGGIWSLDAQVIRVNNIAATDPIYYPFFVISLITTILAIRKEQPVYAFIALLGVIAAVYTKYIPVYGLWLPASAVVILIRDLGWRRMSPWLILMAIIFALSAAWLIGVYDALHANMGEAERAASGQIYYLVSPSRNWQNLKALGQYALNWWWTLPIVAAGAAASVWSSRHKRPYLHPAWLLVILPFAMFCIMIYSSIEVNEDWWRARYLLPAAMVVMLLTGVGLAQIWVWLTARFTQLTMKALPLFISCIALLILPGEILANLELVREAQAIDTRQRVWEYTDSTITPEGKIMLKRSSPTEDLWNRSWSGYNGATTFEWVFEAQPNRLPPADFVDLGVNYLATTFTKSDYSSPEIRAWINQLYLLKVVKHVPEGGWSLDLYFYRLLPPQINTDVTFGEGITLDGYDISQMDLTAGDTLHLRPFWNATRTPETNYSIFVHLYPGNGTTEILAQYDGSPARSTRPTSTWDDPEEFIPGSDISLIIPPDLPSGNYTLALGLYDYTTGERLTTDTGADRITLSLRIRASHS
ncbi:MAG: hypothetical protein K8J31_06405 [Anaerolineae bacterium]|nr:hypothetical protein [Anaerolineae bacterium]